MKVLSIKQPWGSVICSGLKHVENRSWGPKTLPLRILIHVGATKVPKDNDDYLPEEWLSLMRNARTMEENELPASHPAVFNDIKVDGDNVILPVNDSIWDQIEQGKLDEIQYDLTDDNAELFLKEDGQMQPLKTITITNNGRTAKYELLDDTYVGPYLTPDNQPYTFTSLAGEEGYQWLFILFVLGKKL